MTSYAEIAVAYPFSTASTRHRVRIGDRFDAYAMCAVDTLGIAPMLGQDTLIESIDVTTGEPISLVTLNGRSTWAPAEVVVTPGRCVYAICWGKHSHQGDHGGDERQRKRSVPRAQILIIGATFRIEFHLSPIRANGAQPAVPVSKGRTNGVLVHVMCVDPSRRLTGSAQIRSSASLQPRPAPVSAVKRGPCSPPENERWADAFEPGLAVPESATNCLHRATV